MDSPTVVNSNSLDFDPLPPLADYFIVAGIPAASSSLITNPKRDPATVGRDVDIVSGSDVNPVLLDYVPQSFAETGGLRRDLAAFVFPEGLKVRKEKKDPIYYTVAFTDETGTRLYGCCFLFDQTIQTTEGSELFVWKCIAFLTKQSRFELMRECLKIIYLESLKPNGFVEPLIGTILNTPAPGYGLSLLLDLSSSESVSKNVICVMPAPARGFPVADYRLLLLFDRMGVANVLDLFAAVLTERKILFVSESFYLLGIAAESLVALMWPLEWPYVFIPLLPSKLKECVEAPTPFIIGVHRSCEISRSDSRLRDVIISDLDSGELTQPSHTAESAGEIHLPERHVSNLRARLLPVLRAPVSEMDLAFPSYVGLSKSESSRVEKLRAIFLEFLLGILTQLMSSVPRGSSLLDAKNTLRKDAKQKNDLEEMAFFEQLIDTQGFQQLFSAWTKEHVNVTRKLSALDRYLRSATENSISFYYPTQSSRSETHFGHSNLSLSGSSISPRSPSKLSRSQSNLQAHQQQHVPFSAPLRRNLIPKRDDQIAIDEIREELKCCVSQSAAPLHLFFAALLLRQSKVFESLRSIETACAHDEESLEASLELLESLLERLDDDQLEKALEIGTHVSKVSSTLLQRRNRQNNLNSSNSSSADNSESGSPSLPISSLSGLGISSSLLYNSPKWHSMISKYEFSPDEMVSILQEIKLPSKDTRMSKATFAQFAFRTGLASDELSGLKLFEALSRLGKKKLTIRVAKIAQYVNHLKEIYTPSKWPTLALQPKEMVLFVSDTRLLNGLSTQRGLLVVTDTRLLFQLRDSTSFYLNIPLKSISRAERDQYIVVVPPGIPQLRILTDVKVDPIVFLNFISAERDLLSVVIQSLSTCHRIASDLSDLRFLKKEIHMVASQCSIFRLNGKFNYQESRNLLLHFPDGFSAQSFSALARKLERCGILNLDMDDMMITTRKPSSSFSGGVSHAENAKEDESDKILAISRSLLELISDLMYAYVGHSGQIDFLGLSKCDALKQKYIPLASQLATIDLRKLNESERLCFFLNVHNALVIHAYTIIGSVCQSYLEWRYFCARASYCIGGSAFSIDDIIHGVIRGNQPLENFAITERFELNDPRRFLAQKQPDQKALFLLCYHNQNSGPELVVLHSSKSLQASLHNATQRYLISKSNLKAVDTNLFVIELPLLFEFFRSDFGATDEEILRWIWNQISFSEKSFSLLQNIELSKIQIRCVANWTPNPKPIANQM